MLKRHKGLWLCVLIVWMLTGLFWGLNYYFFSDIYVVIFSRPYALGNWLKWELLYWFSWALFAPLIFKVTQRFPLERRLRPYNIVAQLAAGLAFSIIHRFFYMVVGFLLYDAPYHPLSYIFKIDSQMFFFNLPNGFLCYLTILLVSHVIDYYQRYQEQELKASRLKAELAEARLQITEAQLQALKMQLNPHFLFNTLNSISALLDEDPEAADEMLARLGDFLRLTLENSGAQEVTLQEELEFLKCYLEIERVRFQDRLSVEIEIAPETFEACVPNLILQPIVENAIRHGITTHIAPGRIRISAHRMQNRLRLIVSDNGQGMASGHGIKVGLGLANTRARLRQMYGESHSFELSALPEGGVQAMIEIPFVKLETQAAEQKAAFT